LVDYLIKNALIVTLDKERRIFRDGAVAIEKDKIADVGRTEDVLKNYSTADTVVDARNNVIAPGFVDAHTHVSAEQLVRGFVPDSAGPDEWVFDWISHIYAAVTDEDEYYSSLHSFIECIKTGTTSFCDGGTIHNLPSTIRAMEKVGIRGVIGKWIWDIPKIPERMALGTDEALRQNEEAVKTFDNSLEGRVRVWPMVIGDYPIACTDELLVGSKEIADRYKVGFSFHQSITTREVRESIQKNGKRPIEHFEKLGILDSNLRLVHMIQLSDYEVDLLAKYDVKIVHCPTTALRLAYGATAAGKFPEMVQKGVCVALGCDGTNSSNHVDMGRAVYLAAGLFKDCRMDINMIPAETALEMGTINGARSIMQQDQIGSIEKGKKADIVLFDKKRVEWTPLFNVVNTLVYTADGKSVDTVFIDGRMVLEKGKMKMLNEFEVYEKVQSLGEDLISRVGLKPKMKWPII
jgi:5-methylthioadenosine/S-adenosylhomocysteine deaminase